MRSNKRGQGVAEYGLIVVLTGLVALLSLNSAGDSTFRIYGGIAEDVTSVNNGSYTAPTGGTGGENPPPSEGGGEGLGDVR